MNLINFVLVLYVGLLSSGASIGVALTCKDVLICRSQFLTFGGVLPVCSVACSLARSCLTNSFDVSFTTSPLQT